MTRRGNLYVLIPLSITTGTTYKRLQVDRALTLATKRSKALEKQSRKRRSSEVDVASSKPQPIAPATVARPSPFSTKAISDPPVFDDQDQPLFS